MAADSDAARRVFGLTLRQLRTQAGMSLRELGRRSRYDYSRLSRVERGEHLIDPRLVPAIDTALATGGLLTLLRSLIPDQAALGHASPDPQAMAPRRSLPSASLDVGPAGTVMVEVRTPDGRTVRMGLSRREFTQLLAGGTLRAVVPAGVTDPDEAERVTQAIDQPVRLDSQVLTYFGAVLQQHFTADKMLGPRQLLGPVMAQIDVLAGLRRQARPTTAAPAVRLLAQYAEFAGWLHQDAGDTTAAMYWSDRANQWAQAAGDYQMVAYMLVRKSHIALLDDNHTDVIELAAAARAVPGPISPKLRALAAQQEARGWAAAGDADQFQRCLDAAANLLRDHPDDVDEQAPVYLHHYDLDVLEEQSATGYRACGHADTAATILERNIAALPDHLHRDRAHQQAKLANTVLATNQPDPEYAIDLGLRCADAARTTGSARITKELHTLDRTLTHHWPSLPGTATLHEALSVA